MYELQRRRIVQQPHERPGGQRQGLLAGDVPQSGVERDFSFGKVQGMLCCSVGLYSERHASSGLF